MKQDKGPSYLKKSCSAKKEHPPSRVNLIDCLNEKNVDPFAGAKDSLLLPGGGGGGTPYNSQYGERGGSARKGYLLGASGI